MPYKVTATSPKGRESKTCVNASEANFWVEKFQDDGAVDIVAEKDGVAIPIADLPLLIFVKTRSCEDCQ
jgi:hypothetical protein